MIEQEIREKIKNGEFVNWGKPSYYQNLSEDFIREFSDRVDWYSIACKQKLSEEFIREFFDKSDFLYIFRRAPLCYFIMNNKRTWKDFI